MPATPAVASRQRRERAAQPAATAPPRSPARPGARAGDVTTAVGLSGVATGGPVSSIASASETVA
ncbi:hypothetical protein AB4212_63475, partial [Streptomyces sp. 2MCAF27]